MDTINKVFRKIPSLWVMSILCWKLEENLDHRHQECQFASLVSNCFFQEFDFVLVVKNVCANCNDLGVPLSSSFRRKKLFLVVWWSVRFVVRSLGGEEQ